MVKDEQILKGHSISKKFSGGQYEELMYLRDIVNVMLELINYDNLTDENKLKYDNFINYNNKVEELKNK